MSSPAVKTVRELPGGRVLFSISVGTRRFSTEHVLRSLESIVQEGRVREVWVLIADRLMLYNKSRRIDDGKPGEFKIVMEEFRSRTRELETRERWVRKLTRHFATSGVVFKPFGWSEFTDAKFADILRMLAIASVQVRSFGDSLDQAAAAYLDVRFGGETEAGWRDLAKLYLLEECALNIRLRVLQGIYEEYYLGDFPDPMLGLYGDEFGFGVGVLTGCEVEGGRFRFFHRFDGQHWELAHPSKDRENG